MYSTIRKAKKERKKERKKRKEKKRKEKKRKEKKDTKEGRKNKLQMDLRPTYISYLSLINQIFEFVSDSYLNRHQKG